MISSDRELVEKIVHKTLTTVGDRPQVGRNLLKLFYEELQVSKGLLIDLQQKKDFAAMAGEAHKIAGGCAYFGTDHLYDLLLHFEKASRAEKVSIVEGCFPSLLEAIDDVLDTQDKVLHFFR